MLLPSRSDSSASSRLSSVLMNTCETSAQKPLPSRYRRRGRIKVKEMRQCKGAYLRTFETKEKCGFWTTTALCVFIQQIMSLPLPPLPPNAHHNESTQSPIMFRTTTIYCLGDSCSPPLMSVPCPDLLAFSADVITIEMLLRFSSIALSSLMHVMVEMQNDPPASQRSDLNSL